MTMSCVNCSSCGKCYKKTSICSACSNEINLLDDSCCVCGEPITETMREEARLAYVQQKQAEREMLFPGLKANREKRQKWLMNQQQG